MHYLWFYALSLHQEKINYIELKRSANPVGLALFRAPCMRNNLVVKVLYGYGSYQSLT
jgi:hypothetical protein